MSRQPLIIDFETCGPLDLKKVGIYRYAEHPATFVRCYAVTWGNRRGYFLDPEDAPGWLIDALNDDDVPLHAHNATVERLIIERICGPRHGWPVPKRRRWRCSAAQARRLALPAALDKLGVALGMPDALQKDKEGKRLIQRLSKPIKRTPNGFEYDNDPVKLDRFGQYCLQDTVAEGAAEDEMLPIPDREQGYWRLTERINDRGVRVDTRLVRRLIHRANEATNELNERIRELTDGAVTALTNVAQIKQWLWDEYRVELKTLRKEDMEGLLKEADEFNLPKRAKDVLRIRQAGAKSSVSKLVAILDRVSADGRLHGAFVYHGASTGRYTSIGVQLQNLVRDVLKDFDAAIRDLDNFTLEQISKALRGVFIPAEGHVFIDVDYSAIEARGVGWLAGCKKLLAIYRSGGDPYCEMGTVIYGFKVTEANEWERFVGKQTILGCFAANTVVLTDSGWKPIATVSVADRVWDGLEWVTHGGVAYQGHKRVETAHGLTATPDHEILTERGWRAWHGVHTSPHRFRSALRSGRSLSKAGSDGRHTPGSVGAGILSAAANAGGRAQSFGKIWSLAARSSATIAAGNLLLGNVGRNTLSTCPTTPTASGYLTACRPALGVATTRNPKPSITTASAGFSFATSGELTGLRSFGTFKPFPGGTTLPSKWTDAKITAGMNLGISGSQRALRIWEIGEVSPVYKKKTTSFAHVFDILNAGPRHRFTVMTNKGPILVHNCGYGMGAPKFEDQCIKFGKPVGMATAEKAVKAYRETFPEIPQLWRDMEDAAIDAVLNPGEVYSIPNGKISFRVVSGYLQMALPSGRRLFYKDPFIRYEDKFRTGRKRPVLWFWGINPKTKQWDREKTWGGTLTENAVQAISRDLLFHAMDRLENEFEIPVVLSVHDQVVSEVPEEDGEWGVRVTERCMTELPPWARGFPVKAKPKIERRFGK